MDMDFFILINVVSGSSREKDQGDLTPIGAHSLIFALIKVMMGWIYEFVLIIKIGESIDYASCMDHVFGCGHFDVKGTFLCPCFSL